MMRQLITTGLLLAVMVTTVVAGEFEDGVAAYDRGDYAAAARFFHTLAEQGDRDAQSNLGLMYYNGEGVPQDDKEALKWFRLAAEQGNAVAQFNLGLMYNNGKGVPQDFKEAVKWFRLAAEQGYAIGQSSLGVKYAKGEGVPQDYGRAYMWYSIAAAALTGVDAKTVTGNRDKIASHMTQAQIAKSQEMAAQCVASRYKNCE